MSLPSTIDKLKTDIETIESLHADLRRQFQAYYIAPKPSFREIQAQERQEVIARIKKILFARLLTRLIANHSGTGKLEPLEIDLQALAEAL